MNSPRNQWRVRFLVSIWVGVTLGALLALASCFFLTGPWLALGAVGGILVGALTVATLIALVDSWERRLFAQT